VIKSRYSEVVSGVIIADLITMSEDLAEAACHCKDYHAYATFEHLGLERRRIALQMLREARGLGCSPCCKAESGLRNVQKAFAHFFRRDWFVGLEPAERRLGRRFKAALFDPALEPNIKAVIHHAFEAAAPGRDLEYFARRNRSLD